MERDQQLKRKIMRRIYGIWIFRRILLPAGGVFVFAFVTFREIASTFFVAKIIENFAQTASESVWLLPRFIASALNHADPLVLLFISFSGIVSFVFAIKLLRSIRSLIAGANNSIVNFNVIRR